MSNLVAGTFAPTALRRHREAAGLSRTRLAVAVGTGNDMIARYERGVAVPSADRAAALAAAIGVPIAALFEGAPEQYAALLHGAPERSEIDQAIERLVAAAPALSPAQIERLRPVLAVAER